MSINITKQYGRKFSSMKEFYLDPSKRRVALWLISSPPAVQKVRIWVA